MNKHLFSSRLAALPLLFALATGACSDGTSPVAPPTPEEEPQPPAPSSYTVAVQAKAIRISRTEACDGRNVFQNPTNGEFHWKVQAHHGSDGRTIESRRYGSVTGQAWPRGAGDAIDFSDTDWTFPDLGVGDQVVVQLRGIEWDGLNRDGKMNDLAGSFTIDAGRVMSNEAEIEIGNSTCGMTLAFDYQVTAQ